jgi:type II secretion system protein G
MLTSKLAVRRRGFTLIELLIVIVVIAILALIVIPRLMNAGNRARSATYTENLSQIEKGLETFHTDMGVYPTSLADLYATTSTALTAGTKALTGYTSAQFHGPYLTASNPISTTVLLPINPYIDNTVSTNQTIAGHWTFTCPGTVNTTSYDLVGVIAPPAGS